MNSKIRLYLAFFGYQVLLVLALPLIVLYILWQKIVVLKPLNFTKFLFCKSPSKTKQSYIWLHAVSVGEAALIAQLIHEINLTYPNKKILLTTTTATGAKFVKKQYPNVEHCFLPFDFVWNVVGFYAYHKPSLAIIVEKELWPNYAYFAKKLNINMMLINARLSEKSFKNYQKIPNLIQFTLNNFAFIGVQTEKEKEFFQNLGYQKSIEIIPNLKYSALTFSKTQKELAARLRKSVLNRQVICFASTHKGEEALFIQKMEALPSAVLKIIVIRHPERKKQVETLLGDKEIAIRSDNYFFETAKTANWWLIDSIGELMSFYALADVSVIGGSFVPAGGHNPLEALYFEKTVLIGPYSDNFQEMTSILADKNFLKQITEEDLSSQISLALEKPQKINAKAFVMEQKKAIDIYINTIHELIDL